MADWDSAPSRAFWYGLVICGSPSGDDTDYFYGYSSDVDAPEVSSLIPAGWTLLESSVRPVPRNRAAWREAKTGVGTL